MGPTPLSRGHLVTSSGGLGSVSVPFSEEQEGLCRPMSGCSHLAERGKAADGWQVCVAEQRLTKRRLGAALGLQAACPALEQQFSRFMSRVPKELLSCLSIFTTFALKTDAKSVY